MRPYSEGGRRSIAEERHGSKRPSGYEFGRTSFVDRGGSIPSELIRAVPHGKEEQRYRKAEKEAGLSPRCPALLPAAVARFGILLATDPGDLVYDPMGGSGTVYVEAEKCGRRAISSERSGQYAQGARIRAITEGLRISS